MRSHGVMSATVGPPRYVSGMVAPGVVAGHFCCCARSAVAEQASASAVRAEWRATPCTRARAQDANSIAGRASECKECASWNAPHAPVKITGNTYYVGTQGLASILITSRGGHVLIDGGLPESAPLILANIRALGFRPED